MYRKIALYFFVLLIGAAGMLVRPAEVRAMSGVRTPRVGSPGGPPGINAAIAPAESVYGVSIGVGKRWDVFRVSATLPYYVVDAPGAEIESGLGDIRVLAEWDVVPETKNAFNLTGSFLGKVPTADESKGLGTGEADYGAFLELAYRFNDWKPFASLGYVWRGDTATINYRDTWSYSLGVLRYIDRDELYASFDTSDNAVAGTEDARFFSLGWLHTLNTHRTLRLDASFGLNDASADVLVNLEMMIWF